jgi:hypothetical protein
VTDDWSVFLDILGPELAAAATAPVDAPPPPPGVVDVLRVIFGSDSTATGPVARGGSSATDAA